MNTENHRIRQLREAAGLSVDEVAAAVGWHPAILARIERGVRPLRDNEADQITAAIRQIEADTVESQAEKTACVRCGTEPRTSLSTARITIGGADTGSYGRKIDHMVRKSAPPESPSAEPTPGSSAPAAQPKQ